MTQNKMTLLNLLLSGLFLTNISLSFTLFQIMIAIKLRAQYGYHWIVMERDNLSYENFCSEGYYDIILYQRPA